MTVSESDTVVLPNQVEELANYEDDVYEDEFDSNIGENKSRTDDPREAGHEMSVSGVGSSLVMSPDGYRSHSVCNSEDMDELEYMLYDNDFDDDSDR